jgi:regulation of enolase protein 1 (concanavalin A-like superfamily)
MRFHASCPALAAGLLLSALALSAQTAASFNHAAAPVIEGIPGPLTWQNPPAEWKIEDGKTLTIAGGKETDWFVSPMDGARWDNTPRLLFKPAADFMFSAKVTVGFHSQWDSGVLVLYVNNSVWAKLCFEMTIEKHPAIVSVVTRDRSDDNNSIAIKGPSVYLKVAKAGQAIFFYASEDGQNWSIIRAFSLGDAPDLRIGFSSQSPAGNGCTTVFSEIHYLPQKVDLWAGK